MSEQLGLAYLGKALLALLAALLLAVEWRASSARSSRLRRSLDVGLAALAVLAALAWTNGFAFRAGRFFHAHDAFHYYVGSKYFAELGYTGLYRCTALADREAGLPPHRFQRIVRDLDRNELVPTEQVLAQAEACRAAFGEQRWRAFRADVDWFRARLPLRSWLLLQTDHGYNPSPAWTLLGGPLAGAAPAGDAQLAVLAALDPLLLAVACGFVLWAFGWRTLCVLALAFGLSYPARFEWVGGSYLRHAWLAALLIGLCLLRRARPAGGGALLAAATLLRIFPGSLVLAAAVHGAADLWRRRTWRPASEHARFAVGCGAALLALVALSEVVASPRADWRDFLGRISTHAATPLTNHVGLPALLSFDRERRAEVTFDRSLPDPFSEWKRAREETLARRRPLQLACLAAFAPLLWLAVRRSPLWVAALLGIGLWPLSGNLTSYYFSGLCAYALLHQSRPAVPVALCLLNAAGWFAAGAGSDLVLAEARRRADETFFWISLATVAFVWVATALVALGGPRRTADDPPRS